MLTKRDASHCLFSHSCLRMSNPFSCEGKQKEKKQRSQKIEKKSGKMSANTCTFCLTCSISTLTYSFIYLLIYGYRELNKGITVAKEGVNFSMSPNTYIFSLTCPNTCPTIMLTFLNMNRKREERKKKGLQQKKEGDNVPLPSTHLSYPTTRFQHVLCEVESNEKYMREERACRKVDKRMFFVLCCPPPHFSCSPLTYITLGRMAEAGHRWREGRKEEREGVRRE